MTMVKGNDGVTLDNIDLTHAKTLECEECGCKGFKQTLMLKKLSSLLSPTGQESIIPVAAFACEACGHINKEFQDERILRTIFNQSLNEELNENGAKNNFSWSETSGVKIIRSLSDLNQALGKFILI